jgi:class 3 adenylate cyclase
MANLEALPDEPVAEPCTIVAANAACGPTSCRRLLLTLLFTDIVGSTRMAERLGDEAWLALLQRHRAVVRAQLARVGGREVDSCGDGFFAIFPGPALALRCAEDIGHALVGLGIEIRAGVHAGECEFGGDRVSGIAVHVAARIAALARPMEVLVSDTVRDLVAGSGLTFSDRGRHALKGLSGSRQLFALGASQAHPAVAEPATLPAPVEAMNAAAVRRIERLRQLFGRRARFGGRSQESSAW